MLLNLEERDVHVILLVSSKGVFTLDEKTSKKDAPLASSDSS